MRFPRLVLSGVAVLTPVLFVSASLAQDQGGRRMFVDFSQRLEGATNVDLDPDEEDDALVSTTGLTFGISTATPLTSLGLQLGARYRKDFEDSESGSFEGPDANVNYARRGAGSSFTFGASYDSREVEYLDALDLVDFIDETGELPVDLDEFEEFLGDNERTGTRDSLRFNTALALGTDGPFGLSFRLSGQDIAYSGVSEPSSLEDSRSLNAGVTGRFDVNPVLGVTASLNYRRQEEENASEETSGIGVGLSYRRPGMTYGTSFDVDRVDGETRLGISGSLSRAFPGDSRLNLTLGLVQTTEDELTWNGSAAYNQPLSRTQSVNVAFRRAVNDDPDEGETVNTALTAGYAQSLTRLTSLGINAQFTSSETLDIDAVDSSTRISATLSRQLTRDWSLTGGLTHTMRDQENEDSVSSNAIFLQIGRSFQTRF